MNIKRFSLILFLFLTPFVYAAHSEYVLKFAMIDIKPYYYLENGQFHGEAMDYLKRIFDKTDYKYSPHIYPIKRLLKYLYAGEIDLVFLPEGIVDPALVNFAEQSTSSLDIGLYYNKSSYKSSEFKDLNNKQIIVVKNYNYSGLLPKLQQKYPEMTISIASSPEATFKMLEIGRGDAVLAYKRITESTFILNKELRYKSLYSSKIYMIFSPKSKHPNPDSMMKSLNIANNQVVEEDRKLSL